MSGAAVATTAPATSGLSPADTERSERVRGLLAVLPASVQMPAGTGKTNLLVDVVREIAGRPIGAPKVLVLNHTNARVQAIRRRLGAELAAAAHVATITSFAFEFARASPQLGGAAIPKHPDWGQPLTYLQVCRNRHVQQVLRASFTHVLVDEYQDCSRHQHELVLLLRDAIPATGVLGDPLQTIFDPRRRGEPQSSWWGKISGREDVCKE